MLMVKKQLQRYHCDCFDESNEVTIGGVFWFAQKLTIGLVVVMVGSKLKQGPDGWMLDRELHDINKFGNL